MCNALALSTSSAVLSGAFGPKLMRMNEKRIETRKPIQSRGGLRVLVARSDICSLRNNAPLPHFRGHFKRKVKNSHREVLALIPKVRTVFCLQHLADADT
jgi:hypothetical protein